MNELVNVDRLERDILDMCRAVRDDRAYFGTLTTQQKCAVALVLDDVGLMRSWGTALDCMFRLDTSWLQACLNIQRSRVFKDPPLSKRREIGESYSDYELDEMAQQGGPQGSIAAELLARRQSAKQRERLGLST